MSINFLLRTFLLLQPNFSRAIICCTCVFLSYMTFPASFSIISTKNFRQPEKYTAFYLREKLNSMNLLLYMAPMAVFFLLPATIFMEENVLGVTLALAKEDKKIIWYLLFNSSLAYFVNLTNFLVTKHTSALTLQVHYFSYYFSLSPKITKHITSINFRFLVMPKVPWRLSFRY